MIKYLKNFIKNKFPNIIYLYKVNKYDNYFYHDFLNDILKISRNQALNVKISKSPIIFDVGSCEGWSALNFIDRLKNIQIHCFEPSLTSYKILKKNLNNRRNVTLNCSALSSSISKSKFYTYRNAIYVNRMHKKTLIHQGGSNEFSKAKVSIIKTLTLDNYCLEKKVEQIDILRLDANGHDLQILKGARNMLQKKRIKFINICFYSISKTLANEGSLKDIEIILNKYGFKLGLLYNGFIHPDREGSYFTATFFLKNNVISSK